MTNDEHTRRERAIAEANESAWRCGAIYASKHAPSQPRVGQQRIAPENAADAARTNARGSPRAGRTFSGEDAYIAAVAVLSSPAMGLRRREAERLVESVWEDGITETELIKRALQARLK